MNTTLTTILFVLWSANSATDFDAETAEPIDTFITRAECEEASRHVRGWGFCTTELFITQNQE